MCRSSAVQDDLHTIPVMRNRTLVVVVLAAALIVGAALSMRAQGGGALHRWFAAIHGR
jgi:hypothetical protein